jgi:hypothetical protein
LYFTGFAHRPTSCVVVRRTARMFSLIIADMMKLQNTFLAESYGI